MKEMGRNYTLVPSNTGNDALKYVGSYKLTNTPKDENYFGSCEHPKFLADRSQGKLTFKWLTDPIPLVEARNNERQLLCHYDAMHNSNFYNSSNGGGAGVDSSYECDPDLFKQMTDIIDGKVDKLTKTIMVSDQLADAREMEDLAEKVKMGQYPSVEVAVALVALLDKTQPRYYTYDKQNLQDLERWFSKPDEARKYLTPIVLVSNDETGAIEELVEGSHRLKKAIEHKWVTLPAVILPRALFKNKRHNLVHFGAQMNNRTFIQAGNSIDDLKKRIRMIGEVLPKLKGTSSKFKDVVLDQLQSQHAESSIRYYCDQYEKQRKEDRLKADINFIAYDKTELNDYGRALKYKHKDCAIEVQKIDSINNSGFGGIQSLMTTGKKKKGIILVHYPKATMLSKQKKHLELFKENMKWHGINNITLMFLDPFNKGNILGLPPTTK
jgi:hypothetical protein